MYEWVGSVPTSEGSTLNRSVGYGWLPTINAGSLLLKPNKAMLSHMLEIAPIFKYNTVFAEQGLLNGRLTTMMIGLHVHLLK